MKYLYIFIILFIPQILLSQERELKIEYIGLMFRSNTDIVGFYKDIYTYKYYEIGFGLFCVTKEDEINQLFTFFDCKRYSDKEEIWPIAILSEFVEIGRAHV